MNIDFDKYGHCVNCHKSMIIKEIIDQKPTIRFTPEYTEVEYLLDDGSKMRVACCITCKDIIKNDKHDEVMTTVVKGWEEELKRLDWTDEHKQNYLDEYSQKKIVCHSEDVAPDLLQSKLEQFKVGVSNDNSF